jgi:uncharacterized delta-60 repeat protein
MIHRLTIATLAMALMASSGGAAFAAPADFDPGFGQNGTVTLDSELVRSLALQPDGRILVAGDVVTNTPGDTDGVVYRLNSAGSLDPTFATGGARRLEELNGGAYALALQPDGKSLVAGYTSSDGLVSRLDAGGLTDQGFGQNGSFAIDSGGYERIYSMALQPGDAKILVAGQTTDMTGTTGAVVYRLNANGSLDNGFGQGGTSRIDPVGTAYAVAVQPDGKVLVAGSATVNDTGNAVVHRLNPNGSPDTGFGQGGRLGLGAGDALALALQPDGKIVIAGDADVSATDADAVVHRLNPNGTLDPTFGQSGRVAIDDGGLNVAYAAGLQPDGKILVAGGGIAAGNTDATVYRLNPDGSLDPGFAGDGTLRIDSGVGEVADAIALQGDGQIVVGGVIVSGLSQSAVIYRLRGGDPASASSSSVAPSSPSAPVLGRLRISPSAFRAAARGPSVLPASRGGGALVSFTLDRRASVRLTVERAGSGRRVGGRCVKHTRANRGKRRCTRYVALASSFTRQSVAGANRFRFSGRSSARRLRSAGYRLVAVPRADGLRGERKRVRFRVNR